MTKKRRLLIIALITSFVLVIITGIGLFFLSNSNTEEPADPKPVPTSGAQGETREEYEERVDALATTPQFLEGNQVDSSRNLDALGSTDPIYAPLATWTANKYVENSITNLYFVSGWWEKKDGYSEAAINKYISPYLTEDLKQQYLDNLTEPGSASFNEFYSGRVYLPAADLIINPQCFDSWEREACIKIMPPPQISDIVITGIDENTLKLDAKVNISAVYQNPNAPEGNLILQPRVYNLSFVISEVNSFDADNPELPIMLIESVDASLEIKDNVDYITNVDS